jgi:hypothetical protein
MLTAAPGLPASRIRKTLNYPLTRDEKDLRGVLAAFRLAYAPAADNAVDSTPQRNTGNDKPTRGDES